VVAQTWVGPTGVSFYRKTLFIQGIIVTLDGRPLATMGTETHFAPLHLKVHPTGINGILRVIPLVPINLFILYLYIPGRYNIQCVYNM